MRNRLFVVLSVLMVTMLAFPATPVSAGTPPPILSTLQPGGFRTITQDLTINVVFVGYEEGSSPDGIDTAAFLNGLPETYRTVNRYPSFYFGNQFLGLTFNYDYNLVYAGESFEDDFFGYLSSIAVAKPRTVFQDDYNDQVNNTLDVGQNYWISAPAVEQWLAKNAEPALGVDTQQYTNFFFNWY